jgi:adenosylhomocysteine nucleosidase
LLVFVAAERRELDGLLVHVDDVARVAWPLDFARIARLHGASIAMVANGPGRKLAGAAVDVVKEHMEITGLISVGFCGGLQPVLAAGDIFVATEVMAPLTDVRGSVGPARGSVGPARDGADVAHYGAVRVSERFAALAPATQKSFRQGGLLSIDRVISTAAEKTELGNTGAAAVEMEAAAVATRARDWNVPFYAVRVITDTCGETFPLEFNQMRSGDGRFSRAKIIKAALRKPFVVFPELIKLNGTTKRAARALGDFLADSRF